MIALTCLCGDVRVEIAGPPGYIHECNCTLCRKSGAAWGYFHPSEVVVAGATASYSREDKPDPAALLRFCARCGATTHWTLTPGAVARFGDTMMGVNMRLAEEADLAGVEVRYPDGRAWSGDGAFGYVREPRVMPPSG